MAYSVLIIDDDDGWRDLIGTWLRAKGCEVSACAGSREAFELVERARPDLVIVDYHLDGEFGTDLCRALRARPGLEAVPMLILTTMAEKMLEIAQAAPLDHFVAKTHQPDELMAVISGLLPGFRWP